LAKGTTRKDKRDTEQKEPQRGEERKKKEQHKKGMSDRTGDDKKQRLFLLFLF
jgi:hypothetical protein